MKPLRAVPAYEPSDAELRLEEQMMDALDKFNAATDQLHKHLHWQKYKELHQQRSPRFVAYMERQKGLQRNEQ